MLPYTALDALQAMLAWETGDAPLARDGRPAASHFAGRCVRWFRHWTAGEPA